MTNRHQASDWNEKLIEMMESEPSLVHRSRMPSFLEQQLRQMLNDAEQEIGAAFDSKDLTVATTKLVGYRGTEYGGWSATLFGGYQVNASTEENSPKGDQLSKTAGLFIARANLRGQFERDDVPYGVVRIIARDPKTNEVVGSVVAVLDYLGSQKWDLSIPIATVLGISSANDIEALKKKAFLYDVQPANEELLGWFTVQEIKDALAQARRGTAERDEAVQQLIKMVQNDESPDDECD